MHEPDPAAGDNRPVFEHISRKNLAETQAYNSELSKRFSDAGVTLESYTIDIEDFKNWLTEFTPLLKHYRKCMDVQYEKCLEHYLSYKILQFHTGLVHIDVASARSKFTELLVEQGINSYRLDMKHAPGINGRDIGADACETGLKDGFADLLTLHCAYECFMGSSDMDFFAGEAGRIMSKQGRLLISPLYVNNEHLNITSRLCHDNEIVFDDEAKIFWRGDRYNEPFSRHYSPESFAKRIYNNLSADLEGKVIAVENIAELTNAFPGQRFYAYFLFYVSKKQA